MVIFVITSGCECSLRKFLFRYNYSMGRVREGGSERERERGGGEREIVGNERECGEGERGEREC